MTITVQPATQTTVACRNNPDLWQSGNPSDQTLAAHICRNHCPFLHQCATFPATPGAVQAGVLHNRVGAPAKRQPKPNGRRCTTCSRSRSGDKPATSRFGNCGTYQAYQKHKRRGEDACEPCEEARRRKGGSRRRVDNLCGTIAGLIRHREAGELACAVCIDGKRIRGEHSLAARVGDPATYAAKIDRIRTLAGQGMTDPAIAAEMKRSKRQIQRLRAAHGIPAGRPGRVNELPVAS